MDEYRKNLIEELLEKFNVSYVLDSEDHQFAMYGVDKFIRILTRQEKLIENIYLTSDFNFDDDVINAIIKLKEL